MSKKNCIKHIFKNLTDTKVKKVTFTILSIGIILLILFGVSKTNLVRNLLKMAGIYTQEEKVVEIYSNDWESEEPGSIKITKSADWVDKNTAELNIDIQSKVKTDVTNLDIILAIDTSYKTPEQLSEFMQGIKEFTNSALENSENQISLISFNDESTILTDFTNDKTLIDELLYNITTKGDSDYFLALKDVESLLSNYVVKEERDIVVLFVVDGVTSNVKASTQYEVIKEKYYYATINGIAYRNDDISYNSLGTTTDYQYKANKNNLSVVLSEASLSPDYYEYFSLNEIIDSEFYIENKDTDIEVSIGDVKVSEDEPNEVEWIIPKDTFRSGNSANLNIKVKFNSNDEGYYATNEKTTVAYKFIDEDFVTLNASKTPVLKNGYKVVYDVNAPTGCNITSLSEETHYAFDNVTISSEVPLCDGYVFGGWNIVTDNVDKINDDEFVMPSNNVDIKGTWRKLSISKSMQGQIYLRPTYYNIMKAQSLGTDKENNINFGKISSDTNGKGVYTLSGTENNEYPIYFYRGDINNNNVIFANFCWKMVRTTETGGVKMIYNGVPTNGTCDNTGTDSQLADLIKYNSTAYSLAEASYMYGTQHLSTTKLTGWNSILGLTTRNLNVSSSNYIYGKKVTYSSGKYTITDGKNYSWDDEYYNLKGYYTCFSETAKTCTNLFYVNSVTATTMERITLNSGQTYESLTSALDSAPYYYGNDIEYSNGKYILKDTMTMSIMDWETEYESIGLHHYTCLSNSTSCETIYYVYYTLPDKMYYVALTDGKTQLDIINETTSASTNENSSVIKTYIDEWYSTNMIDYTKYLEDTTWCNDRSIYLLGPWDKDTSHGTYDYLRFSAYDRIFNNTNEVSLECPNEVDQFRVNNPKAKLTYPVGLLTGDEVNLSGAIAGAANSNENYYLNSGEYYWLMTPVTIRTHYVTVMMDYGGYLNGGSARGGNYGVRPAISLAPGIQYTDGDGSVESPYIVETIQ